MAIRYERAGGSYAWRMSVVRGVFGVLLLVLIGRLFFLQVVNAEFYRSLAEGQHTFYEELVAERGDIIVRDWVDGREFAAATNELRAFVYAEPRKIEDGDALAKKIAEILGYATDEPEEAVVEEAPPVVEDIRAILNEGTEPVPVEAVPEAVVEEDDGGLSEYLAIRDRLRKVNDPYEPIARNVTEEQLQKILALESPGIFSIYENTRAYPERAIGGHLFGFLGVNEEGGRVGRYGIEGYFNEFLSGANGFLDAEQDTSGRWIGVGARKFRPAVDGGDVVLTIDRTIQYQACKSLVEGVERYQADSGAVVVLEPSTGKVMAICSNPDFDPNAYFEVDDIADFNNLAISFSYEPGSVIKPLVMAGALNDEVVSPTTTYNDEGFLTIGEDTIRNFDGKGRGIVSMVQVLEQSLNTGMVYVMRQMGQGRLKSYLEDYGFGQRIDVGLSGERQGTLASLDNSSEIYFVTASYGQGFTATPLQIAGAYGALANDGVMMKPYIVDELRYVDGVVEKTEPKEVRRVLSSKTATLIGGMLVSVIENGYDGKAGIDGYYVAGKSGTAQVARKDGRGYEQGHTIATFVGYGPIQDPKYVIVVMLDHPRTSQWASDTSVVVGREISEFLLHYLKVAPTR